MADQPQKPNPHKAGDRRWAAKWRSTACVVASILTFLFAAQAAAGAVVFGTGVLWLILAELIHCNASLQELRDRLDEQ